MGIFQRIVRQLPVARDRDVAAPIATDAFAYPDAAIASTRISRAAAMLPEKMWMSRFGGVTPIAQWPSPPHTHIGGRGPARSRLGVQLRMTEMNVRWSEPW